MESQTIRVLDVVLIGPVMLYAASLLPKENATTRDLLALFGFATIAYNYRNYQSLR